MNKFAVSAVSAVSAVLLMMALSLTGCGTTTTSEEHDDTVRLVGIVDVLHAGTRSETVIITDEESGDVFALVGEKAFDIVPEYGQLTAVIGRLTEEGYSVREELQKVHVIDYSIIGVEDLDDY
ncbi:MAG: hypothetical protein KAH31_10770 [Candidatus Sabulitectum sp.]|nr:hypothetical protein [Candidatus Sabulitectum sp.]